MRELRCCVHSLADAVMVLVCSFVVCAVCVMHDVTFVQMQQNCMLVIPFVRSAKCFACMSCVQGRAYTHHTCLYVCMLHCNIDSVTSVRTHAWWWPPFRYVAAARRYESIDHIPDRLLVKLATACIASRNFSTAQSFVGLLVRTHRTVST